MSRRRGGPRSWHRRIGITTAVLLALFVLTGIAIQHQDELGLDRHFVSIGPILDLYGIRAPATPTSFATGTTRVTALGERLYVDESPVDSVDTPLIGATLITGTIVVATTRDLLLLTTDGALIERRAAPSAVRRLGVVDCEGIPCLLLDTADGILMADADLSGFVPADVNRAVAWAVGTPLPDELRITLERDYRSRVLSVARLLQDLHSGRAFGTFGVFLADAAGVALLALAVTGLVLAPRRWRQGDPD